MSLPQFLQWRFAAPRYWPEWFGWGVLRVLNLLPWSLQRRLGVLIGEIAWRLARGRRQIALENLARAMPSLQHSERQILAQQHFRELGIGVFGITMAWWASDRRIARLIDINGLQHLRARAADTGAFVVAGHFTTLDLVARALNLYASIDVLYRPLGRELSDAIMHHGRRRCGQALIDKSDPRRLLRQLRAGRAIWIAVDQADTTRQAVTAPFFNIPVPTNTTVSRLASRTGAQVLPVSCIRQPDGRIQIQISAPLDDFGGDLIADATRLNALVQTHIALAPPQYYWVHRRFKGVDERA
ncbi:MAG: lipid A biosynthesis acyltransferase [Pseudomonadota bacterium]